MWQGGKTSTSVKPMTDPALKQAILEFDPTVPVERAWTPPASWYREPAVAELERGAVFARNWQALARSDQVRHPGQYVAGCAAGEPWVLTRDKDGTLHALSNVCRHKATQVAQGEGQSSTLQCRYHGWTYGLDGRLKTAPHMGRIEDFDRSEMSLPRLGVTAWGPLVMIHGSPDVTTPLPRLAPLTQRLEAMGWDQLRFGGRRTYPLACNWKVFCDNYLDGGYHVASLHPGLANSLDLNSYRTELFDGFSIQSCSGGTDSRIGQGALYAFVYPNLMLNRYGPVLDTNVVVPTGPDSCEVVFDFYFDHQHSEEQDGFIAQCIATSEQVQREDMEVCASVQQGLGSQRYSRGRYAPAMETAIHQFHLNLARNLRQAIGQLS
jgi:choline monooxygenase